MQCIATSAGHWHISRLPLYDQTVPQHNLGCRPVRVSYTRRGSRIFLILGSTLNTPPLKKKKVYQKLFDKQNQNLIHYQGEHP